MNKVIMVGNLTRDPEIRKTPSDVSVCNFAIAVQRDFSEGVDFFDVTVWREKGENCHKYLKKGKKVAVVGSLQNRSYEDKDGIKRTVTEIIANEVEFLSPREQQDGETVVVSKRRERPQIEAIDDNHLPF